MFDACDCSAMEGVRRFGFRRSLSCPAPRQRLRDPATILSFGRWNVVRFLDVLDSMQPLAREDELPDVDQTLLALDDSLA